MFPTFNPNYPYAKPGKTALLSTPERVSAPIEYAGRGVVIAFVDAGFYMHPDLGARVLVHADATTKHVIEQPRVMESSDLSWHGQMTSVIACGDGRTSNGRYRGIASEAQIVLVKVSNPRGGVKEADILRGLSWVYDTRHHYNVRIVNLSVGGDEFSADPDHPIHRMVRKLANVGVVVIAAAGNSNRDSLVPPASATGAITVGGYSDNNTLDRAQWTIYHHDYGVDTDGTHKPEILAPAEWIPSPILPGSLVDREARWLAPLLTREPDKALKRLLQKGYNDLGIDATMARQPDDRLYHMLQARINGYKLIDKAHQHVDGTSVSAAIVSSVVAQMLEAEPRLTPEEVRAILTTTAKPLPTVPGYRQGAGVIQPARAVQIAAHMHAR
ncbi:MAG: S8 family serine peptidase [Chloroflexota bacterium]|nr:S8 family serine peptidase [Chloroflexota bacterium]